MYSRIMVPVDLAHKERLEKALRVSADLAKHYGASICYVGVTTHVPSSVAHNAKEYGEKLESFAGEQGDMHGIETSAKTMVSHDPSVDLNHHLLAAVDTTASDLVVMASHIPGLPEHFFASHAGYVASHARCAVFVIR